MWKSFLRVKCNQIAGMLVLMLYAKEKLSEVEHLLPYPFLVEDPFLLASWDDS